MKRLHYGWVIAGLAAVIFSFYSMRFNTFGVLLIPLTEEFGWDRGALAWAPSITSVFAAILSLFVARLADKYGPRYFVTAAGLLVGVGFLLMSRVTQLWHVYCAWGLTIGAAQALIYIPVISAIPRWFAVRQSTAIGISVVGFGIGAVIWPPVTQILIDAITWQKTCLILGITDMVVIVTLAQFLKRAPSEMNLLPYGAANVPGGGQPAATSAGLSLKEAMKKPHFWLMGGMFLGFFSCLNVMYVHIVAHARDIGVSPIFAAGAVSLIGGFSIIGRLSIGPVSDKTGIRLAMCLSMAFATTALILLLWSPGEWSFYLFAALFGLAYGTFVPMETAAPAQMFGTRSLGTIMATLGLFTNFGIMVVPPVAGAIFDATGEYKIAFVLCLGLSLMALGLGFALYRLKDTPKSHNIN